MELLRNLDLEAAIIEAPEDLGPRMVYGDWLAAQGDPRGPWFALSADVRLLGSDRGPVYPERNWFKTDRNLAALHQHTRFLAMIK